MKPKPIRPVFSGQSSRPLWKNINAVRDDAVHEALYALGCACQELEAKVERVLITPVTRGGKHARQE